MAPAAAPRPAVQRGQHKNVVFFVSSHEDSTFKAEEERKQQNVSGELGINSDSSTRRDNSCLTAANSSSSNLSPQYGQDSFNNLFSNPNQPLHLSHNSTCLHISPNPPDSTSNSKPPTMPLTHREQFGSLYLLVDTAVGILEKEDALQSCRLTSCA